MPGVVAWAHQIDQLISLHGETFFEISLLTGTVQYPKDRQIRQLRNAPLCSLV
jgi:hypothetical protein